MAYFLLLCQLAFAVILLVAATGKIINSEQFAAALRLSHIAKALIIPIVVFLPILELGLSFGLVLSTSRWLPLFMACAVALFSIFTLWMLTVYLRGLRLRCACFGAGGSDVGLQTILRNIFLIAFSIAGFILSLKAQSPLPALSFWLVVIVFSLGMCFMLLWSLRQAKAALILSVEQLVKVQKDAESVSAS